MSEKDVQEEPRKKKKKIKKASHFHRVTYMRVYLTKTRGNIALDVLGIVIVICANV